MRIPNFIDCEVIQKEDGKNIWSDIYKQIIIDLITALQDNLSDEGFHLPSQPTVNLNKIAANSKNASIPILIWDSTTSQLKINVGGTFKVIAYS